MSRTADILRALPYFEDLPDELLDRVCGESEQVQLDTGQTIIEEGSHSGDMYVLVEGELGVTKRSGDREVSLARLDPGVVVGEIALLDGSPRTATVTATAPSLVVRIPANAFEELLGDPRVVRRMIRTVTSRLRGIEETLRHEERMAALGRMAAQLMHELNNPAAALARSSGELAGIHSALGAEGAILAGYLGDGAGLGSPDPPEEMNPLDRADAEDEVAGWLEERGVNDAWRLAPALVQAGWSTSRLAAAVEHLDPDLGSHLVQWVGLQALADQMLAEVEIAARRISELVRIVKDYSYLDQAPIQEIVPTDGIEDTLVLLKHKLADIEVVLDFEEGLAKVEAPGRDLNQVWTNLIDNAADAMPDGGRLTIAARNKPGSVVIGVSDTGTGMPPEVAERIFDPFYTTKEPGKGTGLGLHTVHTILSRIGGDISVESSERGTTFTVELPTATDTNTG